ncbi:hypothetical protein DEIPH_ctg004orf0097 [Deinococcus phoenicis]|uniref:Uncharacterized protein n=1 Tax=Deinococcus phoenicis TaxID=1476583 RepID=A0A016QUQ0_9DEIO|nr:hypothetical protein [Deinococcus phoenicis]EYB69577.1 hypothetical protein DEIPH_ctg004orf0097 [Deinococcus phoenicis]
MNKFLLLTALLTGTVGAQTRTVFINGVALPATPVQKNGETYYQLRASDLKRVGAITAGGVTPNIEAVKGCVGDTLFNGVYTVQLLSVAQNGERFGAVLKVSNASKKELQNFMLFYPADVKAVNRAGNAVETNNYDGPWFDRLLPGTHVTVRPSTGNTNIRDFTRLLIRPGASFIKELRDAQLPLAKVYNMESDLTCKKK